MLNGKVVEEGSPRDVVNRYVGLVTEREKSERASERGAASFRHGDGTSEILRVEVSPQAVATAEPVCVRVTARFHRRASDPIAGIMIRNRLGIDVFGTNTRLEQIELGEVGAGESVQVEFRFECRLASGEYSVTAATQNWDGTSQDWLDDVAAFTVADPRGGTGVASLATSVQWRKV
jgi:hypothetical protein